MNTVIKNILFILIVTTFPGYADTIKIISDELIYNDIQVSLHERIPDISYKLKDTYAVTDQWIHSVYSYNKMPIEQFINKKTNRTDGISLNFYDIDGDTRIEDFQLDDIYLSSDMSFQQVKKQLSSMKIKYRIIERKKFYKIKTYNHTLLSVMFLKDRLSSPYRVQVKMKSFNRQSINDYYFDNFFYLKNTLITHSDVSSREFFSIKSGDLSKDELLTIISRHETVLYFYESEILNNDLIVDRFLFYIPNKLTLEDTERVVPLQYYYTLEDTLKILSDSNLTLEDYGRLLIYFKNIDNCEIHNNRTHFESIYKGNIPFNF